MTHDTVSRLWRVSGIVQGVGFRWYVSRRARELGADGWVQNLSNGDVLVSARATTAILSNLLEAIKQGPPGARVRSVEEIQGEGHAPPASPFSIMR